MARMRMIQAINAALHEEMARDSSVIVYGEDVEISLFGDTKGLFEKYGRSRIRDTPISENVMSGMAVGAAAAGLRVVCHMMYANFMFTGFDSIANQAAKLRYMTGGQVKLPIVYLGTYGGGRSAAAQHSDAAHPIFMNLGGVKVVLPASPMAAKGLLKAAIRDDNPVIFLHAAGRGGELGEVPDEEYVTPLGRAATLRGGEAVTVVAIGSMVYPTLRVVDALAKASIDVEVIDPQTLVPLDLEAILNSVRKTGRLVVVDEARNLCSAASHVSAVVAEQAFEALRHPVVRVTAPDVCMPYAPNLEREILPSAQRIESAIREVLGMEVQL